MALGGCPIQSSFSAVFNDLDGQCSQVMNLCPPHQRARYGKAWLYVETVAPWLPRYVTDAVPVAATYSKVLIATAPGPEAATSLTVRQIGVPVGKSRRVLP